MGIIDWTDSDPSLCVNDMLETYQEYESGLFYKRELPSILSILKKIQLEEDDMLVVDGFVYLDDNKKNGLGGYLFDYLDQKYPVIGIAKKDFKGIDKLKEELIRGESLKPLYITSAGIDLKRALSFVESMHGDYRIPTIVKKVDQTCRNIR